MFEEEARFGRISDARRCWAPAGVRPEVSTPVVREYEDAYEYEYAYAFAAVSPHDGTLDSLVLPAVPAAALSVFLAEVSQRHPHGFILMGLDGAGWHKAKRLHVPTTMRLVSLPPWSPHSIRSSRSGTRCGRNGLRIGCSTAWMRWRSN